MQKVLVVVGPTSSGKSALAVHLAKKFNGEIISADSRQVYRGLDIGTGKITKKEMRGVPHHLLSVASPKRKFSAGDFVRLARREISAIAKRGRLPIVCGGTGFYIDSLLGRISLPEIPPDAKLRASLEKKPAAQLFKMLSSRDPKRAELMNTPSERNNKVRLIRALEIAAAKKSSPAKANTVSAYVPLWIGVSPSATALDKKIRIRLLARVNVGMIAEARRLHTAGLSYKRMRELGLEYRSLADFLEKKLSKRDLIESLERDIRRYARKQTGYWNRNKEIHWFDPKQTKKIESTVKAWLSK